MSNKNKLSGITLLVLGIILIIFYLYGLFLSYFSELLIKMTIFSGIIIIGVILIWIGYMFLNVPKSMKIEDIEKDIESELKGK